jgi:hypothetical protein
LRRWSRPAWPLGQCFARQTKTIPRAPNLRGGLEQFAQSGSERDAPNPDRGSASRSEASRTHSAHVGSLRGKDARRGLGAAPALQHLPPLRRVHVSRVGGFDEVEQHVDEALGLLQVGEVARSLKEFEATGGHQLVR